LFNQFHVLVGSGIHSYFLVFDSREKYNELSNSSVFLSHLFANGVNIKCLKSVIHLFSFLKTRYCGIVLPTALSYNKIVTVSTCQMFLHEATFLLGTLHAMGCGL
jgi:hypothetical protein